ncbi:MAG: hypothetical protein WBM77_07145 [Maribacter sp.]
MAYLLLNDKSHDHCHCDPNNYREKQSHMYWLLESMNLHFSSGYFYFKRGVRKSSISFAHPNETDEGGSRIP